MAVVVALWAPSACSMTEGSGNTLSPMSGPPSEELRVPTDRPTVPNSAALPATEQERWYQLHDGAILRHRDDLWALRDQLAEAPDDDSRVALCAAGVRVDRPAYQRAHDAPGAHADWVRSVDLARWMVASCSGGAVESVREVLPLLDEALGRFDAWLSGLLPDGC
jgi:hypothetical protein